MRRAVVEATAGLRAAAPDQRWMDDQRLHLTLKFIGEQPESTAAALRSSLDAVAAGHRAFGMRIGTVGAFPNFRRARVVWMGVHTDPRLELLHHDVELACQQLGFELEGRAFRPHLTLARMKDGTPVDELRQLARAGRRIGFEAETLVRSVDLMRSIPERSGSRYDTLHAASLRLN